MGPKKEDGKTKGPPRGMRFRPEILTILDGYAEEKNASRTWAAEELIQLGIMEVRRRDRIVEEYDLQHPHSGLGTPPEAKIKTKKAI